MKTGINLTIIFCAVTLVALGGVVGGVVLTIFDKDATAFYGFFGVMITTVTGFGGLLYGQNKANNKLDTVDAKVNGNLSKLIDIAVSQANATAPLTRSDAKVIREVAGQVSADTGDIPIEDTEGGPTYA